MNADQIARRDALKFTGLVSAALLGTGSPAAIAQNGSRSGTGLALPPTMTNPRKNPRKIDMANVGSVILQPLYDSTKYAKYACYFALQAVRWNDFQNGGVLVREGFAAGAGKALGAAASLHNTGTANPDASGPWVSPNDPPPPYFWHNIGDPKSVAIQLNVVNLLASTPAFLAQPTPGGPINNQAPLKRVFVNLDSFQTPFPYDTAALIATCFIKGFVTRYVLGQYVKAWSKTAITTPLPISFNDLDVPAGPGVDPAANPSTATDNWLIGAASDFARILYNQSAWTSDYRSSLTLQTDASIQMIGLLAGWRAVDKLSADGSTDAASFIAAAWKAIGFFYSLEQIGAMIGYTLMTFSGFAESDRTQAIRNSLPTTDPGTLAQVKDTTSIFQNLTNRITRSREANNKSLQTQIRQLEQVLAGELYSILTIPTFATPAGQTLTDIASAQNAVLTGFVSGMTQAADHLFYDFYKEGYYAGYSEGYELGNQIGYSNGFRDGYSQGYAGGYQAGYSSGASSSSSKGFLGGLNSILSGIGGALGSTDTILKDVLTAGTTIVSIVSLF